MRPPLLPARRTLLTLPFLLTTLLAPFTSATRLPPRDWRKLGDSQLKELSALPPAPWESVDGGHMSRLLVERVSGTPNNTKVQLYLSSVFAQLGWHEEKDTFTTTTPHGDVEFTNLVYTFDPDAPRKLVLAAHFDSKWFESGGFIGATDSAAPVGFLIDVAEALTPLLLARQGRIKSLSPLLTADLDEEEAAQTTLQILLFDGEEAFVRWTDEDSVYGSRHLAAKWDETYVRGDGQLSARRMDPIHTVLDGIDVLVLLDLLGAPNPQLQSHYRETDWLFNQLGSLDRALRQAGAVNGTGDWFTTGRLMPGAIDDDHRPFLERGVPVLHLIPYPFPAVWHNMGDNAAALDLDTCRRWTRIMRAFAAGYLGLAPGDGQPAARTKDEL